MASESEKPSEPTLSGLAIAESIRSLAAHNARATLDNEEQVLLFLRSWWSRTYNRPLQDPLLLTYTLEQLLYEFYDRQERALADEEGRKDDEVKEEEQKDKANMDWAEQMEREELAQLKAKAEATAAGSPPETPEVKKIEDPTKDPENIKWMEEQIKLNKKIHGESFGEDIETDFQ